MKIKEQVDEILKNFLEENGLELYNVEFVKEVKDWFLRVYVDKKPAHEGPIAEEEETYISTDECEMVSRFLSAKLDELDPIEQNYYLEVSSPGMDRPLLKDQDFIRYAGRLVDVKLYKGLDGKKEYEGRLVSKSSDKLVLDTVEIPMELVSKVRLAVVF